MSRELIVSVPVTPAVFNQLAFDPVVTATSVSVLAQITTDAFVAFERRAINESQRRHTISVSLPGALVEHYHQAAPALGASDAESLIAASLELYCASTRRHALAA